MNTRSSIYVKLNQHWINQTALAILQREKVQTKHNEQLHCLTLICEGLEVKDNCIAAIMGWEWDEPVYLLNTLNEEPQFVMNLLTKVPDFDEETCEYSEPEEEELNPNISVEMSILDAAESIAESLKWGYQDRQLPTIPL